MTEIQKLSKDDRKLAGLFVRDLVYCRSWAQDLGCLQTAEHLTEALKVFPRELREMAAREVPK